MIRTVVVDDDFRVASIHSSQVERVRGFTVVSQAHSAAALFDALERVNPDLVLLDLYLPDRHGLDVLRDIRRRPGPQPDVIVITAARDVVSIRTAMQNGALHYLVKPFTFATLEEKLRSYHVLRHQLASDREADQVAVDRIFASFAKGHPLPSPSSGHTLDAVESVLARVSSDHDSLSAMEVARLLGVSRATAQRYLGQLVSSGRAIVSLRYGTAGRPENRYRWWAAAEHPERPHAVNGGAGESEPPRQPNAGTTRRLRFS